MGYLRELAFEEDCGGVVQSGWRWTVTATLRRLGPTTFEALRNPAFRRMWPASLLWYTGRHMETTIASWLVLQLTNSPAQVSFLGISRMLPMLLFGFLLGSLADRYSKRNLILISQAMTTLSAALMLYRLSRGAVDAWYVILHVLVLGISWSLLFSSWRSHLSDLFPAQELSNAMSLDVVAMRAAQMVGPLLGGVLIAVAGYAWTYVLITSLYLCAFVLIRSARSEGPPVSRHVTAGMGAHLGEAVQMISANRTLRAILLFTLVMNLFGYPYMEMVSVIARDVLKVGSTLYGLLGAVTGLASLVGSLTIASLHVRRQRTLFSLGALLEMIVLIPFALSSHYGLSVLTLVLAGLVGAGFNTMQFVIVLQASPPEMRGRAMGAVTLAIGMMPLGIFVLGQLAEAIGPQIALALLESVGVVAALLLLRSFPELLDKA